MKQYIVTQSFTYNKAEEREDGIVNRPFSYAKPIVRGTYSESDFNRLVDKTFFSSGRFKKYCAIGWIKVIETKDVTAKTVSKSLDIL